MTMEHNLTNEKVSIVVPTRNRAYTLGQVIGSFYGQADVSEVVIINDAGSDNTSDVVEEFAKRHKKIRTVYLHNSKRKGAAYSRMEGVEASLSEFILFCDDDEFLGPDYARVCRRLIEEKYASVVSGRRVYRLPGEDLGKAISRFGNGISNQPAFGTFRFRVYTDARFEGNIEVPFTHGIFMARRSLLLSYGLDPYYSRGNGFREESDVQIRAFVDGHRVLLSNNVHSVHLHPSEVKTGGQRVNRFQRYYWTVYYTHYFYNKYFDRVRGRLDIPYSRSIAIIIFALIEFYIFFGRPILLIPVRIFERWRT
jgi:glycosyltransferase involved in cell wall biosynthesis